MLASSIIDSSNPIHLNAAVQNNIEKKVADIKSIWKECLDKATQSVSKFTTHIKGLNNGLFNTCTFN